jgi:hypothetical protein
MVLTVRAIGSKGILELLSTAVNTVEYTLPASRNVTDANRTNVSKVKEILFMQEVVR